MLVWALGTASAATGLNCLVEQCLSVLRLSSIYLSSKKAEFGFERRNTAPSQSLGESQCYGEASGFVDGWDWDLLSALALAPFTPLTSPMGAYMLGSLTMYNNDLKQEEKHVWIWYRLSRIPRCLSWGTVHEQAMPTSSLLVFTFMQVVL